MSGLQTWDPQSYASGARFVTDLGEVVLELLQPIPGERILDLGCGDGVLTAKLAVSGCDVVGVDSSAALIEAARTLGLDVRVMDACDLAFVDEFDAVFSNAALHWIKQPDDVIASVWRALKPGGRFVGEMGSRGNIDAVVAVINAALRRRGHDADAVNPWYFPPRAEYRERLETRGFRVRYIDLIDRPTRLPGDMLQFMEIIGHSFMSVLGEHDRQSFAEEVQAELEPTCRDAHGIWTIGCVRLRFVADKPGKSRA